MKYQMDKYEKLEKLLTDFVAELDIIGFDVFGENADSSVILEITDKENSIN